MRRSRSSFDLSDAIVAAEALSPKPPEVKEEPVADYGGVPLVAFSRSESTLPAALPPPRPAEAPRRLPPPPDLANVASVAARCDRLVEWLRSAPTTTNVLLVDGDGLPVSSSSARDEALLGATAGVAAAMKRLALATPGSLSREFESHVGDGPILSLIGLVIGSRIYVVGLSHDSPLGERDVAQIRASFQSALTGLAPASGGRT
jgi:hypothetical protein